MLGNSEFVAWLINLQSEDDDKDNVVDVNDKNGDTPLHLATREGKFPENCRRSSEWE